MPDTATRTDVLLDEVRRLQLHLAAEQSEHRQTRAKLDAARRTADREWSQQDEEIDRLRAELAARDTPPARPERTGVGLFGTVVYLAAAAIVAGGILRGAGIL